MTSQHGKTYLTFEEKNELGTRSDSAYLSHCFPSGARVRPVRSEVMLDNLQSSSSTLVENRMYHRSKNK